MLENALGLLHPGDAVDLRATSSDSTAQTVKLENAFLSGADIDLHAKAFEYLNPNYLPSDDLKYWIFAVCQQNTLMMAGPSGIFTQHALTRLDT